MPDLAGRACPLFSKDLLEFIKGDPTNLPCQGCPTIIEMWASWCGPCRVVFPHISELARKHAKDGLKVVGICLEPPSAKLTNFVQQQGDKMDYTVAADKGQKVSGELMGAAQVTGIPYAFVVDREGVIRYNGHPAEPKMDEVVRQVCVGASAAKSQQELPRITQSREELAGMPVRALKNILRERSISTAGLAEKSDLVDCILERCVNVSYYA
ncbi:hypothetical protein WJX84_008614 [Apatococcus fuscideae]|uniref:Thioredoxin domain-containing protein n=1 Tax=Apatococcus fuscideae TaxID=2026836 RepID=A0AAW1T1N9_9CHLO